MAWSTLETLAMLCVLAAGGVFLAALKFALREAARTGEHPFAAALPRAQLFVSGSRPSRWRRIAVRRRLIGPLRVIQAGFVAIGITSVFAMFLGLLGAVILGSL